MVGGQTVVGAWAGFGLHGDQSVCDVECGQDVMTRRGRLIPARLFVSGREVHGWRGAGIRMVKMDEHG